METVYNYILNLMMLWAGDLNVICDHTAINVNFNSDFAIIEYYNVKYPEELELDLKRALENWERLEVNPRLENVVKIFSVYSYQDIFDQTVVGVDLNIIDKKEFLLALGFEEPEDDYFYFSHFNSELDKNEKFSFSLGFIPDFRLELKSDIFDVLTKAGITLKPVPADWLEDQEMIQDFF